jgi:hypothetical protein
MSSTAQSVLPVTIILASPRDWDEWLAARHSRSTFGDILTLDRQTTTAGIARTRNANVNPEKSEYDPLNETKTLRLKALLANYERLVSNTTNRSPLLGVWL